MIHFLQADAGNSGNPETLLKKLFNPLVTWFNEHETFKIIVLVVLGLLLLYITLTALIYLFLNNGSKLRKWNWFNIGHRAAKSIFSLDFLLAILFLFTIFLIDYCITQNGNIELTILTVSFTLAAIIPYLVGRTIAKNEVDNIIEDKFNKRFQTIADTYNTSINSLRRSNAHYRRIAASLLSKQSKEDQEWAIGWAAEAILSYLLIKDTYEKADEYAEECGKIITNYNDSLKKEDTDEKADEYAEEHAEGCGKIIDSLKTEDSKTKNSKDVHERTLKSVLTMHAYRRIRNFKKFGKIEDQILIEIEKVLWKQHVNGNQDEKNCAKELKSVLTAVLKKEK